MFHVRALSPANGLSGNALRVAALYLLLPRRRLILASARRFAHGTTLPPNTVRYNRAELRNVLYDLQRQARAEFNEPHAPVERALYELLGWADTGPDAADEHFDKWFQGMSVERLLARSRQYWVWRAHLNNRVSLVRKALNPQSGCSERQHHRVKHEDPLIWEWIERDRNRRGTIIPIRPARLLP